MASLGMGMGAGVAVVPGSSSGSSSSSRLTSRTRTALTRRAATGRSGGGAAAEEKGPLEWVIGLMQKDNQMYETDALLQKVEKKSGSRKGGGTTSTVSVPANGDGKNKKFPGLGGLFAGKN